MIWTPPGAPVSRRAEIPTGEVRLGDGRLLRSREAFGRGSQQGASWKTSNGLAVIATMDDIPVHGRLLHVSLSYRGHLPSWEDVRLVKDAFFGDDLDAMMVLPKAADYVNEHPYTFHLTQTPVSWGIR